MAFNPGDRVQIKSGGPIMTVERVDGDSVTCAWMQNSGPVKAPRYTKKIETFAEVTLAPAVSRSAMSYVGFRMPRG